MEQLTVNGLELDTISKQISRKIRVAKLGKISDRLSSISQQFKLPKTTNNVTVFEHLGVNGNTSRVPYTELRTNYSIATIPVINNGFMTIESVDKSYYNVRIQDGIIDLGTKLKGLKLSDLPLGDLNHYLNTNSYKNSFSNTEGYIYAVGDFGYSVSEIEKQVPSIFVHTLWAKIFQNIGITYGGDFFTTNTDFRNEVITLSNGIVPINTNTSITNRGGANSNTINISESSSSYLSRSDKHIFTNSGLVGLHILGGDLKSTIAARMTFIVVNNSTITSTYVSPTLKVNGVTKYSNTLNEGTSSKTTTITVDIEIGDIISLYINSSSHTPSTSGEDIENFVFKLNYTVSSNISVTSTTGGTFVDVAKMIGDLTQLDFIKDVMNRYGLFMTPVKDNQNAYNFQQIDTILNNTSTAIDWTEKLIAYDKETFKSGLAKKNLMKFKYPSDTLNFAQDGSFSVDDFNSQAENTLYNSPFEIPVTTASFKGFPLFKVPLFKDESGNIKAKETPNKLMSIKRKNTTIAYTFFGSNNTSFTGSVPILSLDKIEMQHFLDAYYLKYKSLMNDYVARTCTVDLSVIDIANLRFDRLYYFGQFSRYCFLNEVQYKANDKAKIEIIQIN